MKCKMTAKARVNPTEDMDKVIQAVSNILKFDELEIGEGYIEVTGGIDSLIEFRESLKQRKIRDTAKKIFLKGIEGNSIKFTLNKQAALVSTPNFVEGKMSGLGDIEIKIETDNTETFIEWMTLKEETN